MAALMAPGATKLPNLSSPDALLRVSAHSKTGLREGERELSTYAFIQCAAIMGALSEKILKIRFEACCALGEADVA